MYVRTHVAKGAVACWGARGEGGSGVVVQVVRVAGWCGTEWLLREGGRLGASAACLSAGRFGMRSRSADCDP